MFHPCPSVVKISPMKPEFMRAAIRLSLAKMRANCGGPFGAVVVRNGKIIARGWNQVTSTNDRGPCGAGGGRNGKIIARCWNQVTSTNDPTAHAEVTAIRAACKKLKTFQLDDCELYTSCEPCPMCLAAIYWARLKKVYYANTRQDADRKSFDDDLIYRELAQPVSRRKVPMKQLLRPEALKVFAVWKTKADKIHY